MTWMTQLSLQYFLFYKQNKKGEYRIYKLLLHSWWNSIPQSHVYILLQNTQNGQKAKLTLIDKAVK